MSPRKIKTKEKASAPETPVVQEPQAVQTPSVVEPTGVPPENEVLSQLKRISDHIGFLEKKIDVIIESMKKQRPHEGNSFSKPGGNYRYFNRPGFNKPSGYNNGYRPNSGGVHGGHGGHSRNPYHGMGHGGHPGGHNSGYSGGHGGGHFHQKFSHHAKPPMSHPMNSNQQPVAYASDPG